MKYILLTAFSILAIRVFGQVNYTLGEKDFTDEKEKATIFTSFNKNNLSRLKDSVDLSSQMPPPGDQGTKGSCWAWATTYVLRSVMDHPSYYSNRSIDYTKVYSPEYVYQIYKGNIVDCNRGEYSFEILQKVLDDGVVKFSEFRYNESACNVQPNASLKNHAKAYAKPGYTVVKLDDLYSIQYVLAILSQPLLLSIKVDDFFCKKGNINKKYPFWNNFNTERDRMQWL